MATQLHQTRSTSGHHRTAAQLHRAHTHSEHTRTFSPLHQTRSASGRNRTAHRLHRISPSEHRLPAISLVLMLRTCNVLNGRPGWSEWKDYNGWRFGLGGIARSWFGNLGSLMVYGFLFKAWSSMEAGPCGLAASAYWFFSGFCFGAWSPVVAGQCACFWLGAWRSMVCWTG